MNPFSSPVILARDAERSPKSSTMEEIRPGVLNREQTTFLGGEGIIKNLQNDGLDPSSFELHLSRNGWRMKGSFKGIEGASYNEITKEDRFCAGTLDLTKPTRLEKSNTYVFQLDETLRFGNLKLCGRATGKSSIGRLDILTRLIADGWPRYDEVPENYSGTLYLEVTPITFPVIVKDKLPLSQLRVFRGKPGLSELKAEHLELYGDLLLDDRGKRMEYRSDGDTPLTLNLEPTRINNQEACALAAKKDPDVSAIDLAARTEGCLDPESYWEPIAAQDDLTIQIEPEGFYLLRSRERFKLPDDVAVYGEAVSAALGELRIHYAGFVHPGFGSFRKDGKGAPLIFEVRAHNVSTFLRHGETIATIKFYRMSQRHQFSGQEKEKARADAYENQELRLSKHFKDWQ